MPDPRNESVRKRDCSGSSGLWEKEHRLLGSDPSLILGKALTGGSLGLVSLSECWG